MAAKKKVVQWGFLYTALWGYSLTLTFLSVLLALLPSKGSGQNDAWAGILVFAPVFIFLVSIAFNFRDYFWNARRVTLEVYSLLLYFFLLVGAAFTQSSGYSSSDTVSSLILAVLFAPPFIFFILLGNERFT